MSWLLTSMFSEWITEAITTVKTMISTSLLNTVFNFEKLLGITATINNVQTSLLYFAILMITIKILYKLFNVYILKLDGDDTASPIMYLKSYVKGLIIIVAFYGFYPYFFSIANAILTASINSMPTQLTDSSVLTSNGIVLIIFALVYLVMFFVLYIRMLMLGVRMLLLRLAIPFATVGLIDNNNGIYSTFIQLLQQTIITAIAQIFLLMLSLQPLVTPITEENAILSMGATFLSLIASVSILSYAFKVPQDLNHIFLGAQHTGFGSKVTAGVAAVKSILTK